LIASNFVLYRWLPVVLVEALNSGVVSSYFELIAMLIFMASSLIFLPTFFMGVSYSILIEALSNDSTEFGKSVGIAYAANALGSIVGASVGGILLVPLLGLERAIYFCISGYLLVALIMGWLRWSVGATKISCMCGILATLMLLYFSPRWDPLLMQSGAYMYSGAIKGKADESWLDHIGRDKLLYYKEGLDGIVSVTESDQLYLKINGKTDATSSGDAGTQIMIGHLPILFHQEPKSILVVGLGSGISAGSVATHNDVEKLDIVEISKEVIEASNYFSEFNGDVLSDPRVSIINADARSFLTRNTQGYDVIISQASNPWQSGSSKLFTREYFRLLKEKLVDDQGIVASWVNAYSFSEENLASVLSTFAKEFDYVTIWRPMQGDFLLLGSNAQHSLDYHLLEERLQSTNVRNSLSQAGVDDLTTLLSMLIAPLDLLPAVKAYPNLNSDNHPIVEYSAYKSLYSSTVGNNMTFLMKNMSSQGFELLMQGLAVRKGEDFYLPPLGLQITGIGAAAKLDSRWLASRRLPSGNATGETIAIRNQVYLRWVEEGGRHELLSTLPGKTLASEARLNLRLRSDVLSAFQDNDLELINSYTVNGIDFLFAYSSVSPAQAKFAASWLCNVSDSVSLGREANRPARHLFVWQGPLAPQGLIQDKIKSELSRFSCGSNVKFN
jgi:spermidine synthase